jgi:hypothetical protein
MNPATDIARPSAMQMVATGCSSEPVHAKAFRRNPQLKFLWKELILFHFEIAKWLNSL